MNTTQIKIGELYAARIGSEVVRFKVTRITTVTIRVNAERGSSKNTITGIVAEGDAEPGSSDIDRTHQLAPELIISHYTEYAGLKAKEEEEERIAEEKKKAWEALRARLVAKLYEITGLPVPELNTRQYGQPFQPFRTVYSLGIEIVGEDAVAKVLEALEKRLPL